MTQWQATNLNHKIRFKLTPKGKEIWRQYWRPYSEGRDPLLNIREGPGGWREDQIWQFAAIFGPHMWNGCDGPVETAVEIEVRGSGSP